jgi:hypothetical protein
VEQHKICNRKNKEERTIGQTMMEKELRPKSMVVDGFVLKAVNTKFFLFRRKPEESDIVSLGLDQR